MNNISENEERNKAVGSNDGLDLIVRRAFVCVSCEGIYLDSPVTECDCAPGANIFIESVITYKMPNVKYTPK